MSSNLLVAQSNQTKLEQTETCKVVVFIVSGFLFALPISAVFRVTQMPSPEDRTTSPGIIYMEDKILPLLNLQQVTTNLTTSNSGTVLKTSGKFLIIAHSETNGLCGISADEPPTLINIALSEIYPLPISHRQAIGNLADYVAILSESQLNSTVFLLNLHALANL